MMVVVRETEKGEDAGVHVIPRANPFFCYLARSFPLAGSLERTLYPWKF